VTLIRGHFLTTVPIVVVALCYAIAAPSSAPNSRQRNLSSRVVATSADDAKVDDESLRRACEDVAAGIRKALPSGWELVIHEPFVIAGDLDEKRLHEQHKLTIEPTVRALSIQYFDHAPAWPVSVVLCSSDESYRECCRFLGERERSEYSGLYSRWEHRVIVNVATGDGTLAHELTHALAHADFPEMPEWLDEGLASLHEECEFSPDGMQLLGLSNWRGAVLTDAMQRGEVRPIASLATEEFASSDRAGEDYAHARYFCLFLQQSHLLEAFYRKCRTRSNTDPSGVATMVELFRAREPNQVDAAFLKWLQQSGVAKSRSASRVPRATVR
jgi:hypothetical protein